MKRVFLGGAMLLALVGVAWAAAPSWLDNIDWEDWEAAVFAETDANFSVTRQTLESTLCYQAAMDEDGPFVVPALVRGKSTRRASARCWDAGGGVTGTITAHSSQEFSGPRYIDVDNGGQAVSCTGNCSFQFDDGDRGLFFRHKIELTGCTTCDWACRICIEPQK